MLQMRSQGLTRHMPEPKLQWVALVSAVRHMAEREVQEVSGDGGAREGTSGADIGVVGPCCQSSDATGSERRSLQGDSTDEVGDGRHCGRGSFRDTCVSDDVCSGGVVKIERGDEGGTLFHNVGTRLEILDTWQLIGVTLMSVKAPKNVPASISAR